MTCENPGHSKLFGGFEVEEMKVEMRKEKDRNVILCGLCGEEIASPKGLRTGRLSNEQGMGAHESCMGKQQEIMGRHGVNPNIEFQSRVRGLLELHPEVEQSKPVFDYRNREDEAKEELYKTFPYLKKKVDEAEKAKKKVEEAKAEKAKAKKVKVEKTNEELKK